MSIEIKITDGYKALASDMIQTAIDDLTSNKPYERITALEFFLSGSYQLFTAFLDEADENIRKRVAKIMLANQTMLKIPDYKIYLFLGDIYE